MRTPWASRAFLYVDDCAHGIILATKLCNDPEIVNLGAGFEITIKDLAEKIRNLVGYEGKITWDTRKPDGQPRRALDTTRPKEYFGFQAATPSKTA